LDESGWGDWFNHPFRTANGWYVWTAGDSYSGYSDRSYVRGWCPRCERGYKWPRWLTLLRDAYCPECGGSLERVSPQTWRKLKRHATLHKMHLRVQNTKGES